MVVGVLQNQDYVQDELFRITQRVPVNSTTMTFKFTTIDEEPVANFRNWYGDPQMIGKHFLVYSVRDP